MPAPKDYRGEEIKVGDVLHVAFRRGYGAEMETRYVSKIYPDGRVMVRLGLEQGGKEVRLMRPCKAVVDIFERHRP